MAFSSPKRLPNVSLLFQLHIFKAWRMIWLFRIIDTRQDTTFPTILSHSHSKKHSFWKCTWREMLALTTEGFILVQILGRNKYCICFHTHIYCFVMPKCNATWVDMPSSHEFTFKRITKAFMHHDKILNIRLEALVTNKLKKPEQKQLWFWQEENIRTRKKQD